MRLALTTRAKEEWLRRAAKDGELEKVREVLKEGVDPEAADPGGYPNRGKTPCHYAAENGHSDIVTLLVNMARVDVNKPDEYRYTPLSFAARGGHFEIVELLVANGADVNLQDMLCDTPLHHAAAYGNDAVAKLLLESGVNLSIQDKVWGRIVC